MIFQIRDQLVLRGEEEGSKGMPGERGPTDPFGKRNAVSKFSPPPFPSDGRGWKRRMNFRKLTDTRALASHMNDD